jgi:hypothetical protein
MGLRPAAISPRHRDVAVLLGLLALGVGLPLLVSTIAGSLEIPRNDDWSYRRIATEFARTGRLVLDGAAQTMLIGQIAITQPLLWISGAQPWAFAVAGAFFASAAVCSAYALARQLVEPRSGAICALLVLLFPGFLAYATSFMSDVPAVAAQWACLAAAGVAFRRSPIERRWLLLSLAFGIVGFSIREFAIAAPVAVLAGLVLAEPRRPRTWVLAGVVVAVAAVLLLWRAGLPGQLGTVSPRPATFERVPLALSSTTMVLLPAALIAFARRRRRWHRLDLLIGANVGLLLLLPRLLDAATNVYLPESVMENLTTRWGVPWPDYILGGRPVLIADAAWWGLNLLALVSTLVVPTIAAAAIGEHARRMRPRSLLGYIQQLGSVSGVFLLYCALVAAGLIVYAVILPLYDRYLWALIPPASALLLYDPIFQHQSANRGEWVARGGAVISSAALAALSLVFLLNSHAFDAARWRAGSRLVETGISAASVDAGYEWMGYHAMTRATAADPLPARIWYEGWWPDFRLCGFASSTPDIIPDARLLGTIDYRLYLVAGPTATIHLYGLDAPTCG